ncbi:VOC family protein [Paenibacillus sp. UNC451MF]|uniref:VOC family protein n=1 Tax=Paenibacillus sp. UNC451MF TaxID=1449063 RepID=UPI00048AD0C8|nr:VOC family protein [Paenibacillus sp. UNC451MF]
MTVRLIPYLVMNGNAKEAIEFYEKALNAKVIQSLTFANMPENPEFPMPDSAKELIAHALLKVGETDLMLSDTFPGQPHQSGNQVTICISTRDASESKQMYEALQQGGHVKMPLEETHFSPAFGNVRDKFGITFQIFTEGQQQ